MSADFVKDPADVLKLGQIVKVRVKEIDDQGRVNLSMLFGDDTEKKNTSTGSAPRDGGDRGPRSFDGPPREERRVSGRPSFGGRGRGFGGGSRGGQRSSGPRGPRSFPSSAGRPEGSSGIRNDFGSAYSGPQRRPRR